MYKNKQVQENNNVAIIKNISTTIIKIKFKTYHTIAQSTDSQPVSTVT